MARAREWDLGLPEVWKPTSFIVDCAAEEQNALSEVWPDVKILLCIWHVRRAWTVNILKKVRDPFHRARMNEELGDIMYGKDKDASVQSLQFMLAWKELEPVFVAYYETYWHYKISKWVVNFRRFDHCGQNTNGSIERWHHTLKVHLRRDKANKRGRKVVWLVEQLVNHLEHHYWCMSCLKWQGRVRNRKIEDIVWSAILKARKIPDEHVNITHDGSNVAHVRSQSKPDQWHVLEAYMTDSCICTCDASVQGNTCKHQIKLLCIGGMKETKILQIYGTKYGTMVANMEFRKAEWPEASEVGQTLIPANVTIPFVDPAGDEPFADLATWPEDTQPEAGDTQPEDTQPETYGEEHFDKVYKEVLSSIFSVPHLNSIGMTKLLKFRDEMYSMEARHRTVQLGPSQIFSSTGEATFKSLANGDMSLKCKESFVDKMYKRRRSQANVKLTVAVVETSSQDNSTSAFVKSVTVRESDQFILNKAALKSIDLNADADWYYSSQMGQGKTRQKKATKLVSSQGNVVSRGCKENTDPKGSAPTKVQKTAKVPKRVSQNTSSARKKKISGGFTPALEHTIKLSQPFVVSIVETD